jgi:hypothetical protein
MADSGAVRQRRYKAHKRGDHRYCRHLREMPAVEMLAPAGPGELDPVAELQALAGRLAAAYDTDRGNTAIARELRLTLSALIGLPGAGDEPDPLADLLGSLGPSFTPS